MTILKKRPLRAVALGALLVGAISCGSSSSDTGSTAGGGLEAGGSGNSGNAGGGDTSGGTKQCPGVIQLGLSGVLKPQAKGLDYCPNVFSMIMSDTGAGIFIIDGAGPDNTLKISGTVFAPGGLPNPTYITGVQTVQFTDALTNASVSVPYNLSGTTKSNGTKKYIFDDIRLLNGQTITTLAGQEVSFATGPSRVATAGTVTWAGAIATGGNSLTLNLDGYQGGLSGVVPPVASGLTVTGVGATRMIIESRTSANAIGTFTGPTSVTSHVIKGNQNFSYKLAAADVGALDSINSAELNAIKFSVDLTNSLTKPAFTFAGGTSNDSVRVIAGELATLSAGSQFDFGSGTADKLIVSETASLTSQVSKILAMKGLEILGFGASGSGADISTLSSSINQFSVEAGNYTTTFTNGTSNSQFYVDLTAGNSGTVSISNATGSTTTTVKIDNGSGSLQTLTALSVSNAANVNLSSTGASTVSGATNVITTLTNATNANIVVTGNTNLSITNALAAQALFDASGFTGNLVSPTLQTNGAGYVGVIGSSGTDTIKGGSGVNSIQGAPASTASQADTLTGGAGGVNTYRFVATGTNTLATDFGTLLTTSAGVGGVVKITNFRAGTDKIWLEIDNTAGTAVAGTSVAVTALTASPACADLSAVYTYIGTQTVAASTAGGALNAYTVTCTNFASTGLSKTFLFINNATAGVSNSADMLIDITGISGTLSASDFTLN